MQSQLQKAIDLVRKTGDRLLVLDMAKPQSIFAVMSMEEYERLVVNKSEVRGLTEDELLDKINRDIAIWKSEQDYSKTKENTVWKAKKYLSNFREKKSFINNFNFKEEEPFDEYSEKSDSGYFSEAAEDDLCNNVQTASDNHEEEMMGRKNPWAIPPLRKEGAEEIIEEDRQYLENIN